MPTFNHGCNSKEYRNSFFAWLSSNELKKTLAI